jgi:hypothetical protein
MTDETAQLRQTLSRQYIAVLSADFESFGEEAVKRLREKDPSAYLRAIAAATADVPFAETTWSEFTDADLLAALAAVEKALRIAEGADRGVGAASEREQARALPTVPEAETVS